MKYLCLICAETVMEQMSEADASKHYEAYREFTEDIRRRGHLIGCNRLVPPHAATTIRVRNGKISATDGPFAETKELIAGFWLLQVSSREEALEWAKRIPTEAGKTTQVEVRRIMEAEDFGEAFTAEARAAEDRLRETIAEQHG